MRASACLSFFVLVACGGGGAPEKPPAIEKPPATPPRPAGPVLSEDQALGKALLHDERLSANKNQACDVCHGEAVGWTGPSETFNAHGGVYEGSFAGRFGNRKAPSIAYLSASPTLHRDASGKFVGGAFWDGRATGEKLGSPLADQAQGPFLNPLEQALPDSAAAVQVACAKDSPYAEKLKTVVPTGACQDAAATWDGMAKAIAAYESSPEVEAFSSKFDASQAGTTKLSDAEARGMGLFAGKGRCAECHSLAVVGRGPLFTDFTYANIGTPRNPENPFYKQPPDVNPDGDKWIDKGLGGFLATRPEWKGDVDANVGKHKVPTLRNVDKRPRPDFVKAYGHNGYFKSLAEIVHFYNTRDALPTCAAGDAGEKKTCWPAPEVSANLENDRVGKLGLTPEEEADLVAFLGTLTDGWKPGP